MESNGNAKPQEVPVIQEQEEEFAESAMETVEKGAAEAMADGEGVEAEALAVPIDQPMNELEEAKEKKTLTSIITLPEAKRFCSAEQNASGMNPELVVALVDRNQETGTITLDQWHLVEASLKEALTNLMSFSGIKPARFNDAGWKAGTKLIYCLDDYSLKWLCATVEAVQPPWPNAKLAIVHRNCQFPLVKPKVSLPFSMPTEIVVNLFKWKNANTVTSEWQAVSKQSEVDGQKKPLNNNETGNMISSKHGNMAWRLSTVYVNFKKEPEKQAEQPMNEAAGQTAVETPVENQLQNAEESIMGDHDEIEEPVKPNRDDDMA
ncbi:PREDICTED: uncharacterized protein LOC108612056 [Drosophila arizonae]|uniref:Uncharacterized protein LOC108612056 n=1 Tax=Drosophila arizonae TaxID=7263 RepID=A0ABM1NZQ0_DROAR|nr:PREDICTED: uncharacterized protein LOC108612056 [Drosophila arizonae]